MADEVVDLVGDVEFVVDLLNGHLDWRQRLVREFVFGSTTAEARMTSTYDVRFPEALLRRRSRELKGTTRMVIPLGTRPKRLLLHSS